MNCKTSLCASERGSIKLPLGTVKDVLKIKVMATMRCKHDRDAAHFEIQKTCCLIVNTIETKK